METWDALRSRRTAREFADRPISDEDLARILEAGRRAPSSRNWQPWDLVVVRERDRLEGLAKGWGHGAHLAGAAAAVAVVPPYQDTAMQRDWLQFDDGQATRAMMIAAADLGIGSGHSAVQDQ